MESASRIKLGVSTHLGRVCSLRKAKRRAFRRAAVAGPETWAYRLLSLRDLKQLNLEFEDGLAGNRPLSLLSVGKLRRAIEDDLTSDADELDTFDPSRDDASGDGEFKRLVISLLSRVEDLSVGLLTFIKWLRHSAKLQ